MSTQDLVENFIQEQRREARREDIVDLFTDRFGALPADVAAIVARTQDVSVLRAWLKLVARASKEEALASMRGTSAR